MSSLKVSGRPEVRRGGLYIVWGLIKVLAPRIEVTAVADDVLCFLQGRLSNLKTVVWNLLKYSLGLPGACRHLCADRINEQLLLLKLTKNCCVMKKKDGD